MRKYDGHYLNRILWRGELTSEDLGRLPGHLVTRRHCRYGLPREKRVAEWIAVGLYKNRGIDFTNMVEGMCFKVDIPAFS